MGRGCMCLCRCGFRAMRRLISNSAKLADKFMGLFGRRLKMSKFSRNISIFQTGRYRNPVFFPPLGDVFSNHHNESVLRFYATNLMKCKSQGNVNSRVFRGLLVCILYDARYRLAQDFDGLQRFFRCASRCCSLSHEVDSERAADRQNDADDYAAEGKPVLCFNICYDAGCDNVARDDGKSRRAADNSGFNPIFIRHAGSVARAAGHANRRRLG